MQNYVILDYQNFLKKVTINLLFYLNIIFYFIIIIYFVILQSKINYIIKSETYILSNIKKKNIRYNEINDFRF